MPTQGIEFLLKVLSVWLLVRKWKFHYVVNIRRVQRVCASVLFVSTIWRWPLFHTSVLASEELTPSTSWHRTWLRKASHSFLGSCSRLNSRILFFYKMIPAFKSTIFTINFELLKSVAALNISLWLFQMNSHMSACGAYLYSNILL